jgi:chromosome segregation ATPase
MENELLKGILDEIKGLRKDTVERLDQVNDRIDNTNTRIEQTNNRIDKTNEELKGLRESVIILQGGVSDLRYEMQGVKQILGDKVIWQNDNIILQTREGQAIYGVLKRATKE